MNQPLFRLLLCLVTVAFIGAGNAIVPTHDNEARLLAQKAAGEAKQPDVDACALLTKADVQAIQSDPVQQMIPSSQPGGGITMRQCLFQTAVPSKSVSISVASRLSITPRAFWQKQFHEGKPEAVKAEKADKVREAGAKDDEEEGGARPRAIRGVGDEAYWVGGRMVGALYVLKRNTFFRISVGGVREESERIKRSVALARLALKKL